MSGFGGVDWSKVVIIDGPPTPAAVQIGPRRYDISLDLGELHRIEHDEGDDLYGQSDHGKLRIIVDPTLPFDQLADTLLHEVLSAGYEPVNELLFDRPSDEGHFPCPHPDCASDPRNHNYTNRRVKAAWNCAEIAWIQVCTACGALVVDDIAHDRWHAALSAAATEAHRAGTWTNVIGSAALGGADDGGTGGP